MTTVLTSWGFLDGSVVKNPPANARRYKFDPWVGKIPWRRERLPTLVFWPGEFQDYTVHGAAKSQTRPSDFHTGYTDYTER